MKTGSCLVCCPKKCHFNIFNKQQKTNASATLRISVFILLCNYDESCFCPGCLALIHLDYFLSLTPFTPRLNISTVLNFSFKKKKRIWFQHYLLFTQVWCVMQTMETAPYQTPLIFLSLPLPPHQLGNVRGAERHRDISALLSFQSEF